jgi:hypothetical protein
MKNAPPNEKKKWMETPSEKKNSKRELFPLSVVLGVS